MSKKYLMLIALAMFSVLVGSLANIVQSQPTYTDAVKINLLPHDRGDQAALTEGITVPQFSLIVLPFAFSPEPTFQSISGFWITIVYRGIGGPFAFRLNDVTTALILPTGVAGDIKVFSTRITDSAILQAVIVGINNATLDFTAVSLSYLYGIDIFLEYQYSGEAAVGGLWIPVDKFSLLAPYIALVSSIILAVSMSVAYIKYRKKQ